MSEYGEKFNISKLIGAPAGYVGYKESGQLTEKIKHRPYSLVLFDEIEKANPEVFDLLLQILDDGYLTDAAGTKINFRNTIIVMTSNIGSHFFQNKSAIGFGDARQTGANFEEKILNEVKKTFKLEFLNRLDRIIYFSPLADNDLEKIVKLELQELSRKISRQNISLSFDVSAAKLIARESAKENQGARTIKRVIQSLLESPLSEKILNETLTSGKSVHLSAKNGIIEMEVSD